MRLRDLIRDNERLKQENEALRAQILYFKKQLATKLEDRPDRSEDHVYVDDEEVKISVVMTSFLGDYPGARSNPIPKFHRAIKSFLNQSYVNTELIIVSDGCEITNQEYLQWQDHPQIKLIKMEKSDYAWPGSRRQTGVDAASGTWIAYLDSDDMYHPDHLLGIFNYIQTNPHVDAILNSSFAQLVDTRNPNLRKGKVMVAGAWVDFRSSVYGYELMGNTYNYVTRQLNNNLYGTSRTFHRKGVPVRWEDSPERGEDLKFSNGLKELSWMEIHQPTYIVCHIPDTIDL